MTETQFIETSGGSLAFSRLGVGRPVVFLHGIPTHRALWRNVIPVVAEGGHEVYAFDLLGYGESSKPMDADLGISSQARYIAQALRAINLDHVTLVGHDIGGGIAQILALEHRAIFEHLILIDSIAYDSFPEPGIARMKEPVWDNILGAPDFDLGKGLAKGLGRGMVNTEMITPALAAMYEKPFHGVDGRRAYLRAARALRTEELSLRMSDVERLDMPTLILWGDKDVFQPISSGERLAAAMPNAQLQVIEGAGHFLPEDVPETLAQVIVKFLESGRGQCQ